MAESDRSRIFRDGLLEGQVCVVSGAGSGLGRETALELARLGAAVVACGRRAEPLEETAELAAALPGSFEHETLDIREEEPVGRFFDGLLKRHGRLDVLVNNAGGQFLTETLLTKYPQVVVETPERSIPIGRAGRSEEMAWLVAYLASPAGDFYSGTTITLDGARDKWAGPWPPEQIATASGDPVAEERRPK